MGHQEITTLNDIVDTLKLQFYPNGNITSEEMEAYNQTVDMFCGYKEEAQEIKAHNNQERFVNKEFHGYKFRVMATSQPSFNVVLQNGDISIALLRYATNHNNPLIKVEFRAEFLCRYGHVKAIQSVKNLINNLFTNYFVKVSEIHLAKDIQGYEFRPFDFYRIKTLSKSKEIFNNDNETSHGYGNAFTGFTIGKGDEMLRVYNKTKEIAKKKEKAFIDVLKWSYNPDFNRNKTVWRIEFQLRRENLKSLLGSIGLLDSLDNVLYSIADLWRHCIERFVHKNLSDKQIFEQMQGYTFPDNDLSQLEFISGDTLRKRFQRADLSIVWKSIQTFEDKEGYTPQRIKHITKPEKIYVENAVKAVMSTFIKLNRGAFSSEDLTQVFLNVDKETRLKHDVSMVDKARINALDYISEAQTFYQNNGVIEDGFIEFKKDVVSNLKETFAIFENEPSNISTFEEYMKRMPYAS